MPRERLRRHGAERARARVRGALREGPRPGGRSARARRGEPDLGRASARARRRLATAPRARRFSAAPRRRGGARALRASRSRTRWRRRSAAATACRTARSTRSACRRRCASTPSSCPTALLDGRAADRAEELARLAGFTTLSALGVPEDDLPGARGDCGGAGWRAGEPASRFARRRARAAEVGLLSAPESVIHPMPHRRRCRRLAAWPEVAEPRRPGGPVVSRSLEDGDLRLDRVRRDLRGGRHDGRRREPEGRRVRVGPGGEGRGDAPAGRLQDAGHGERAHPVEVDDLRAAAADRRGRTRQSRRSTRSRA